MITFAATVATARRVALQLRHDPRTVVMLLAVPSLLLVLLRYVYDSPAVFAQLAPALLGVFPFVLMFLVTSITTLRERTSGTLERLMTTRSQSWTCSRGTPSRSASWPSSRS